MNALGTDASVGTLHSTSVMTSSVAPAHLDFTGGVIINTSTAVQAGTPAVGHTLAVLINGVAYNLLLA